MFSLIIRFVYFLLYIFLSFWKLRAWNSAKRCLNKPVKKRFRKSFKSHESQLYGTKKNYIKIREILNPITNKPVRNRKQILDLFYQHFRKLYEEKDITDENKHWEMLKTLDRKVIDISFPITEEELESTIRSMKSSYLRSKYLQNMEKIKRPLTDLFNFFIRYHVPDQFKRGYFVISYKGQDRDPKLLDSYRALTVFGFEYKVFCRIIKNRLGKYLEDLIHIDQQAYIRDRGITNNILSLQTVLENINSGIITFIDIEKAFDKVDHTAIRRTLEYIGFTEKSIRLLLGEEQIRIRLFRKFSPFIKLHRGVAQGNPLSPYLFIMVLECLNRMLHKHCEGITWKNYNIKCIIYSDDILLFSKDTQDFEKSLRIIEEFGKATGLKINEKKSSCFVFGAEKPPKFKEPEKERYLGVYFNKQGIIPVKEAQQINQRVYCYKLVLQRVKIGRLNEKLRRIYYETLYNLFLRFLRNFTRSVIPLYMTVWRDEICSKTVKSYMLKKCLRCWKMIHETPFSVEIKIYKPLRIKKTARDET